MTTPTGPSSNGLLFRVSSAHAVSHLHIMAVPAMLPLLPQALDASFVELGFAIGMFNIVTALVQAPLGFAVDKLGARRMLIAALALGALSFGLLAVFPSYTCLLVAMALAGLANGVYHPADYALLSRGIDAQKMGRAFSIHTSAGYLGGALAPPLMVGIAVTAGAQWSFAVAALAGAIALACVAGGGQAAPATAASPPKADQAKAKATAGRPLKTPLLTLVTLTLLFTLLSLSTGAIDKFSVTALMQGFAVPLSVANSALTAFLFASAAGVLAGGVLADRTQHHGVLAAAAFALAAVLVVAVILVSLPALALVVALGLIGFLTGVVAPSRDMLVRAASPVGAEGRTFGIVSTGFNIGGVLGPLMFGLLLDRGLAAGVLWASVAFMAATVVIVLFQERSQAAARQPALAGR